MYSCRARTLTSRTAQASRSTPSMSRKNRLNEFAEQAGFDVEVETDVVRAVGFPVCLQTGLSALAPLRSQATPRMANRMTG